MKLYYDLLTKNVSLNSLDKTVHTYHLAIGHQKNNASYLFQNRQFVVNNTNNHTNNFLEKKEKVQMTSIDQFVKDNKIKKIDFIKTDTEGNEYNILIGAKQTLIHHKPSLFIECDSKYLKRYGHTPVMIYRLLKEVDYKVFYIVCDSGIKLVKSEQEIKKIGLGKDLLVIYENDKLLNEIN